MMDDFERFYRIVAKRIHPDLAVDENERSRRHETMIEVNRAYEEGDVRRLREILSGWESNPDRSDDIDIELIITADVSKAFAKMLNRFPAPERAWFCLGVVYETAERINDAISAYKNAVKLKPDYAEAWDNLACALDDLGIPLLARDAQETLAKLQPDDARVWNNLGFFDLECAREVAGSELAFEKALHSWYLEDSIIAYRKAIKLNANYALAWNYLGSVYNESGRVTDAITACQRAIKLKPDYAEAWANLAQLYERAGRVDEAREAAQRASELSPRMIN